MKIIRSSKIRGFILTAAFSAGLGCATSTSAQVSYLVDLNSKTVTVIGNVVAYGINNAGQVVGFSGTAGDDSHAFITGPNGMGMRDLGTLGGSNSIVMASTARGRWLVSLTRLETPPSMVLLPAQMAQA